jgi:hypothetical protein
LRNRYAGSADPCDRSQARAFVPVSFCRAQALPGRLTADQHAANAGIAFQTRRSATPTQMVLAK